MRYIVVKMGVYMQGIYGLYKWLDDAVIAAQTLATQDRDDYHLWEVHCLRDTKWEPTGWEFRKQATLNEVRLAEQMNKGVTA